LPLIVRLRMEEENISAQAAVVAVLKDNIHGLELDERCTQIAAFNVALTAWKLAGYQVLPSLHLACSGLAPSASKEDWIALAGDNERASNGMARLHSLFKDAPVLGSLINPCIQDGGLFDAEFHEISPLLKAALASSENQKTNFKNDDIEIAVIAQGLAKAAELLAGQFTLVITNVPYLGNGKQDERLKDYCERNFSESMNDLSTCFVERCLSFCAVNIGTIALVTPQNWLFQTSYIELRKRLLKEKKWNYFALLGPKAFQTPMWDFNVMLLCLSSLKPESRHSIFGIDVSRENRCSEKAEALKSFQILLTMQETQLNNPDYKIVMGVLKRAAQMGQFADSFQGLKTGDDGRFRGVFWEIAFVDNPWRFFQSTVPTTVLYAGREAILRYENSGASIARNQGQGGWGRIGVAVSQMALLPVTIYQGDAFDSNVAPITPREKENFLALWSFCSSMDFPAQVRQLDQKTAVANGTFAQIPFDLAHWQKVAAEKYPDGLPKPHSDDPTQWLFYGHPNPQHPHGMLNRPPSSDGSPFIIHNSSFILHIALARLLGYRWPRQTGSSFPDCPALGPDGLESFADKDGIVCLPPINREQPAAARLRQLLTAALGQFDERALIAAAGLKGSKFKTLEDWLRDEFFEQHAKIFHDRPFIWHLWDGRPDGFHVLVNYHKLDHATLQKLTYSYLGDWIRQQDEDAKADKPGAAERLGAARALQVKLAAILEGEEPLDIFVRWKPIKEQAQGWRPDLNDGIRQNIRPFLLVGDVGKRGGGLFRTVPLKLKDKDRGTEPHRPKTDYPWFWCEETPGTDPPGGKDFVGNRWNDVHLTLAAKKKV